MNRFVFVNVGNPFTAVRLANGNTVVLNWLGHGQAGKGVPDCPDCGKPMTKRKAARGVNAGNEFWGCTGYPECKGLRNIQGAED